MGNPLLPGSDLVGFGFNCLGPYNYTSATNQIFQHLNEDAETIQYPPTGSPGSTTYSLPDNLAYQPIGGQPTTDIQVFTTQQELQNYFAAKAGITGSYAGAYGVFTGELQAGYSETAASTEAYFYGLCRAEFQGYTLILSESSAQWLSPSFTSDPDYQNLPSTYDASDPTNQQAFFQFFRKWGTHYISQVTAGGCLNYCVSINQEYAATTQSIAASMSAEYKGVFTDVGAQAEADWQQAGQTWANNRQVQVSATGGTPSAADTIDAVDPSYGSNFNTIYNNWVNTLMQYPAATDFALTPTWMLFSGTQQTAVQAALGDYLNSVAYLSATMQQTGTGFSTQVRIIVNGTLVQPSSPNTAPSANQSPTAMFQVALFDNKWNQLFTQVYYAQTSVGWNGGGTNPELPVWDEIYQDVQAIQGASNAAFIACGVDCAANFPSANLAQWLADFGAALAEWKVLSVNINGGQFFVNYMMVGPYQSGPAAERFEGPLQILFAYSPLGLQTGTTLDTSMVTGIGAYLGGGAAAAAAGSKP